MSERFWKVVYRGPNLVLTDGQTVLHDNEMAGYLNNLEARLAEAEAALADWNQARAAVGLDGCSATAFVRHHRNNEAATQGAWKATAEICEQKLEQAEADAERLYEVLQDAALKQHRVTHPSREYADCEWPYCARRREALAAHEARKAR